MKRIDKSPLRVRAYYPNFFSDAATGLAVLRIVMYFNTQGVRADLMGFCSDRTMLKYKRRLRSEDSMDGRAPPMRPIYRDVFPPGLVWAIARRLLSIGQINAISEWRFTLGLKKGDIAYLWPGASLELYKKARERGCVVVSERINTLLGTSLTLLDSEFRALGIARTDGLTQEHVDEELECMNRSDFIFSPSPAVTESIVAAAVPKDKVLQSSYGLKRSEILQAPPRPRADRRVTALFVGRVCVRKGVPLLIKAWEKAAVDARLVFVGRIAPELSSYFKSAIQGRTDIEYQEHAQDVEPFYSDADFFILPSIEEGSPLVSYLALGAGLPLVVSRMGAGGVVEDKVDGLIVDPHDEEGFAAAIRTMVADHGLRSKMAAAARDKAFRYTWSVVGGRRRDALLGRINALRTDSRDDGGAPHVS